MIEKGFDMRLGNFFILRAMYWHWHLMKIKRKTEKNTPDKKANVASCHFDESIRSFNSS